ncbi:alpha/beta hydrolase [Dyadobacter arcticus]|uniref:Xaa-Pro dipeptidyl-peptidase-like domain-containing protein n=1 Tax=Dyadobacter arcticus TaxID=1078754 RepID=A0ABX0UNK8_9BACT|nr:alpha/beta hydrolase [Dyadobacter arcticus]NIJ54578.1 hypothetical protein [Dyadobacter arcticus]
MKDTVSEKKVSFESNSIKIAANLFYPAGFKQGDKPTPAIVVAHPAAGVKEQTAELYAKSLAEKGFITLAFDAAYQGESEGTSRGLEDPSQRVEDIRAAAGFLTTIKDVDAENIGVLGICASGGYSIVATATDHTIKALATVSGVDLGDWNRKGSDGKQDPKIIQGMLDAAAADRIAVLNGKAPGTFPIRPTPEEAKAAGSITYEGWEYYCTDRGQNPRQSNFTPLSSVERIASFYSPDFAYLIAPRPVLMIAGTDAQTLWMTKDAYEKANEPKELFLIEGETHVSLYDHVSQSVPKLDEFFKKNLN